MPEAQKTNWKEKEIGILWRKKGKKEDFLSGFIKDKETGKEQKILIFVNNKNDNSSRNAPDYIIFDNDPVKPKQDSFPTTNEPIAEAANGEKVPF